MTDLILEFPTESEAQACITAINIMAANWCAEHGFSIKKNGSNRVIGKRNGKDNLVGQTTNTWDKVKESPDGTYYVRSLTDSRPEWDVWKEVLEDALGFTAIGTEREFPAEWENNEA